MDWFKRYGIPGIYFVGLVVGWMYALYCCWPFNLTVEEVLKLGAFISLPSGYILSVLSQYSYLQFKIFGLHRKAAKKIGILLDKYEYELEGMCCIAVSRLNGSDLESQKFIQDWIRKRMDVLAINSTMIIATCLAPFVARLIGWGLSGGLQIEKYLGFCFFGVFCVFSVIPAIIMKLCSMPIEREIIYVISKAMEAQHLKGYGERIIKKQAKVRRAIR
jgi:hypothetical protein